jgi:hypothetical protein
VSDTEVEIGDRKFKFRDPNLWTLEEVCDIEDGSTDFEGGKPSLSTKKLKAKTIAKATGLSEKEASQLPYFVGNNLFEIVRWRPVPLEGSLTSSAESGEEEQTQNASTLQ